MDRQRLISACLLAPLPVFLQLLLRRDWIPLALDPSIMSVVEVIPLVIYYYFMLRPQPQAPSFAMVGGILYVLAQMMVGFALDGMGVRGPLHPVVYVAIFSVPAAVCVPIAYALSEYRRRRFEAEANATEGG